MKRSLTGATKEAAIFGPVEASKPDQMLGTSLIISAVNCLVAICGIVSLCLSFSTFDFIVTEKIYYNASSMTEVVKTNTLSWFLGTSILCLVLSSLSMMGKVPKIVQHIVEDYPQLTSFLHGVLLSASSVLCSYCTFLAMRTSGEFGTLVIQALSQQNQEVSHWFFERMRTLAVLFTTESMLQIVVLCLLYLGMQCRHHSLTDLHQKPVQCP
ncbi:hypothetical protein Y032_0022g481 [Ancylostoma ceylanicum]|uniref:Uncharacterized protein n=1 Tax=Ancylostoma ceylanicum TaxID=53326 RepID=A0A016UYC0_9BILA|nr:hypothetical protein Y032_0022g481 [Ancylostoma ceylanicum]